ncbi:MAG TPA: hypothetical protein VL463_22990 [Kofleriaceae bacterium]|nr:hypothetical protein [Kofleriaceae bacterium]
MSWVHEGFGDTTELRVYHSRRVFRDGTPDGVEIDLGDGLRARVPIALPARDGHSIGDDAALASWWQRIEMRPRSRGFERLDGIADVVVVWNVLEHFWPYWDDVQIDWNRELDVALADALGDRTLDEHLATLQRLSAALPDGHARVTCPGIDRRGEPPLALDSIDGQLVVVSSNDPRVQRGDVVVAIDGVTAVDSLARFQARMSGSPQLVLSRAMHQILAGATGSLVHVRIRRGASDIDVDMRRGDHVSVPEDARLPFEQLDDGVWYVDLSRISLDQFPALEDALVRAPGVVFDMRHYPQPNDHVVSLLLTEDETSGWLDLPRFTRPDHVGVEWTHPTAPWTFDRSRHISGRVAFLIGPRQLSYGESLLGVVAYRHLGAIVGAPTAGINGNIAGIDEPTGCQTSFTGMRVTNHDGTRLYQIGIRPTVPVTPTLAGIRAGVDEVLEAGLRAMRGGA